jgi:hypothetical protein
MSEVDLMHVLHRPHLPRLISVTIVAAILAIAISLALAGTLSNISQSRPNPGASARPTASAPTRVLRPIAPRSVNNPLAHPLNRSLPPLPWPIAGRWSPPQA